MSTLVVSSPADHETPRARYHWYSHWHLTSSSLDSSLHRPLAHNGVMKVPPIHLTQLEPDQELDLCDPSCHQTAPSDYTRPLDKNINWYNTHHHYTPQSASIRRFLCLRCLTFLVTWHLIWCTMYVWGLAYQSLPRKCSKLDLAWYQVSDNFITWFLFQVFVVPFDDKKCPSSWERVL